MGTAPVTTPIVVPLKKNVPRSTAVDANGPAVEDEGVTRPDPDLEPPAARRALEGVWLDSRPALIRFLTARCGDAAAAEDVVQDVWIRLQGLSDEAVLEVRQPSAFLYRLAANLVLDRAKARRRAGARDLEWRRARLSSDDDEASDAPSAEDAAWARQKLSRVMAVLDRLPPKTAEAFRLHRFEGLPQAEVADRMGVSRSSVEKYVAAALKEMLLRVGWP